MPHNMAFVARLIWTATVLTISYNSAMAQPISQEKQVFLSFTDAFQYLFRAYHKCSATDWWTCFELHFANALKEALESNNTRLSYGGVFVSKKCNFQNTALSEIKNESGVKINEKTSSLSSTLLKILDKCNLQVS